MKLKIRITLLTTNFRNFVSEIYMTLQIPSLQQKKRERKKPKLLNLQFKFTNL